MFRRLFFIKISELMFAFIFCYVINKSDKILRFRLFSSIYIMTEDKIIVLNKFIEHLSSYS